MYFENIAEVIVLDQSLVTVGGDIDLCPPIKLSISYGDGKKISDGIFSFQEPNKFIINTRDISVVG